MALVNAASSRRSSATLATKKDVPKLFSLLRASNKHLLKSYGRVNGVNLLAMVLLPLTVGLVPIYGLRRGRTCRPLELSNSFVQVCKQADSSEGTSL
jgi:hypothetical protein